MTTFSLYNMLVKVKFNFENYGDMSSYRLKMTYATVYSQLFHERQDLKVFAYHRVL